MKRIMMAGALLALFAEAATAGPDYDRSLEQAAARIVAQKIGTLRGSFSYDQLPEFVAPVDWRPTVPQVALNAA